MGKITEFKKLNCNELVPIAELNGVISLTRLFDALATPANGVSFPFIYFSIYLFLTNFTILKLFCSSNLAKMEYFGHCEYIVILCYLVTLQGKVTPLEILLLWTLDGDSVVFQFLLKVRITERAFLR